MSFITDKQTLDDLNIPGKYRPDSVFSLFNKTVTRGGERLLDEFFQHPLSDPKQINERSKIFQYFIRHSLNFPFSPGSFAITEEYLGNEGQTNLVTNCIYVYWKKVLELSVRDESYKVLHDQVINTIQLLNDFADFLNSLTPFDSNDSWVQQSRQISNLFSNGGLQWLVKIRGIKQLSVNRLARYDYLLRTVHAEKMNCILEMIYHLDVYIAVSAVAKSKRFSFANALPAEKNLLDAINLRHPCIEKAVGNMVSMNSDGNVIFLTGANMAGKSTFMKSFGIALYLAHMGFPVAAAEMSFSVKDGIYTSINVPDDLSMGYSHFYAEVLRVKKVAQEITRPLELIIIFDELFKGTNVKDAYDATLAITAAFSEKKKCFFIISTHITEAGEELRRQSRGLQFVYFPSILTERKPVYTYKLQHGISNDRHGMVIIKEEGILELIGS